MRPLVLLTLVGCADDPAGLPADHLAPPTFTLGGDAWLPAGGSFDLAVTGAPPGVFVGYAASTGTSPPLYCPAAVGCLDLSAPATLIGVTRSDAAGVASYSRAAPARTAPFRTWALQAAAIDGGQAHRSTVHRMTTLPADFCVSNLSWPWATLGDGGDPTDVLGAYGARLSAPSGHGLVGGDAEGDPGGWSDGRSVMTPAWVVVGEGSVQLDASTAMIGFTLGRAGGGSRVDLEITGTDHSNPAFLSTVSVTSDPVTVTFAGPVDRIDVAQVGGDAPAWSLDDLAWRTFGAPCP